MYSGMFCPNCWLVLYKDPGHRYAHRTDTTCPKCREAGIASTCVQVAESDRKLPLKIQWVNNPTPLEDVFAADNRSNEESAIVISDSSDSEVEIISDPKNR